MSSELEQAWDQMEEHQQAEPQVDGPQADRPQQAEQQPNQVKKDIFSCFKLINSILTDIF